MASSLNLLRSSELCQGQLASAHLSCSPQGRAGGLLGQGWHLRTGLGTFPRAARVAAALSSSAQAGDREEPPLPSPPHCPPADMYIAMPTHFLTT